jgi:chemotaxis protein MotB
MERKTRKKRVHGGAHGGAWKVAYADFVPAMMALFIVVWLTHASKPIREAVAGYLKDPLGTSTKVGSSMAGVGDNFVVNKENMDLLKQQLEKAIQKVPNFDKLKDHIEMTITNEDFRIKLMESAKGTFYDIGSPNLNTGGRDIVVLLAREFGKLPNRLAIEGPRTRNRIPRGAIIVTGGFRRSANAARRLMQMNGMREDQVTQLRGFADQRFRKTAAPMDPSNRRISVIVQNMVKPGQEAAGGADAAPAAPGTVVGDATKQAAPPHALNSFPCLSSLFIVCAISGRLGVGGARG